MYESFPGNSKIFCHIPLAIIVAIVHVKCKLNMRITSLTTSALHLPIFSLMEIFFVFEKGLERWAAKKAAKECTIKQVKAYIQSLEM